MLVHGERDENVRPEKQPQTSITLTGEHAVSGERGSRDSQLLSCRRRHRHT